MLCNVCIYLCLYVNFIYVYALNRSLYVDVVCFMFILCLFMWITVHVISLHVISLLLSTLSCIVLYERCYTNKVLLLLSIPMYIYRERLT